MARISERLKHAWDAFSGQPQTEPKYDQQVNVSYSHSRPDRTRLQVSNERSIISSVYTRISIDVAANSIRHVRVDDNDRYLEDLDSGINYCLREEANIDQAASFFIQDVALTLMDKGVIAIVPVKTSMNPLTTGGYDIRELRVGEIISWYPQHVKLKVYNDMVGKHEEIVMRKKDVAIVENPLYMVMNEPNSTLQRIISKLNMLDAVDSQSSSGRLDLIIQLPYTIKSETRREQAEQRRQDIEFQLKGSQYGIAYADATEKIVQLNRPTENNLLKQVEYLIPLLYSQLGLTEEVMNGTANEAAMLNYRTRTIKPILKALTEAMNRTFLTKTARAQRQRILFFTNPFELVPIESIAEIGDKFTRNEILSSNELRQIIGFKPSSDPKADELRNSNMPEAKDSGLANTKDTAPKAVDDTEDDTEQEGDSQNGRR